MIDVFSVDLDLVALAPAELTEFDYLVLDVPAFVGSRRAVRVARR